MQNYKLYNPPGAQIHLTNAHFTIAIASSNDSTIAKAENTYY